LTAAAGEYVSLGGRDAEMTVGVKKVAYSDMYLSTYAQYATDTSGVSDAAAAKTALIVDTMVQGRDYEITTKSSTDSDLTNQGASANTATTKFTANKNFDLGTGGDGTSTDGRVVKQEGQLIFTASEGANATTNSLTSKVEAVQGRINTARVQAGSQYAALESAVGYVTDLTAQYELGYNTVNDVNFSMETAHLAKNQILQQAATAMLAQANQGQASLLQLIQG
jgi:flagellin-like hook-associated protein FlgL